MAFLLSLITACSTAREVMVGNDKLCIPKNNIVLVSETDQPDESEYDKGGPELVVYWEANKVADRLPDYQVRYGNNGKYKSILKASIFVLGHEKTAHALSAKPYEDRLLLTGPFNDAVVSYDEAHGVYKVSRKTEVAYKWDVITMKPGIHVNVPENKEEFWLGSCRLFGDQSGVICDVEFGYRDYFLRVELAGPNLYLRDSIKKFVISYLDQWRVDCSQ